MCNSLYLKISLSNSNKKIVRNLFRLFLYILLPFPKLEIVEGEFLVALRLIRGSLELAHLLCWPDFLNGNCASDDVVAAASLGGSCPVRS